MPMTLTSPVTGATVTGLTSPTYTLVDDVSPNGNNGNQYAVSALGGTQTGVEVHSISNPFTCNFVRPTAYKQLGQPNPVTGVLPAVPRNQLGIITRKGVEPLSGHARVPMVMRTTIDTPAGADAADPESVLACISLHIGALYQAASKIAATANSGV